MFTRMVSLELNFEGIECLREEKEDKRWNDVKVHFCDQLSTGNTCQGKRMHGW